MEMKKQYRITVTGMVQGVSFRFFTREFVRAFPITGEVKNLSDGSVLIIAEGEEQDLQKLIEWTHAGPSAARVVSVTLVEEPFTGTYSQFDITW